VQRRTQAACAMMPCMHARGVCPAGAPRDTELPSGSSSARGACCCELRQALASQSTPKPTMTYKRRALECYVKCTPTQDRQPCGNHAEGLYNARRLETFRVLCLQAEQHTGERRHEHERELDSLGRASDLVCNHAQSAAVRRGRTISAGASENTVGGWRRTQDASLHKSVEQGLVITLAVTHAARRANVLKVLAHLHSV